VDLLESALPSGDALLQGFRNISRIAVVDLVGVVDDLEVFYSKALEAHE
jgi:hypothetical protein